MLDGEVLEPVDVFIVESSATGENRPLTSVDGVRDDREEKSHGGMGIPSPPGPWGPSMLSSQEEDLRMTTVELRSKGRGGGGFRRGVKALCAIRVLSFDGGEGGISGE